MPTWQAKVAAVAAAATVPNAVAGRIGNPPARPSACRIGLTASQAGFRVTVVIGERVFLNDEEISPANRMPERDKDVVVDGELVMPGEIVSVSGRNTAGTATDFFYLVDLRAVA
jgi:hypothetical protein